MEISKGSWHYKLNKAVDASFKNNADGGKVFTTCTYIRTTAITMLFTLLIITAGVGMLVFALTVLAGMIGAPIALFMGMTFESDLIINVLAIGMVGWVITAIVSILFCFTSGINWVSEWNNEREYKASLVQQALKDRKDGICTIVTFK